MLSITQELSCAKSSQGLKAERDSIFVKTEGDRKFQLTSNQNAGRKPEAQKRDQWKNC